MESKERNPIEKAKTKSEIIKDNICNAGAYHPISDGYWNLFSILQILSSNDYSILANKCSNINTCHCTMYMELIK